MSLGKRLLQMRKERGLTQRELAEPRYTHAYISTIEAGRRHPSKKALAHFAVKLGVTVEELESGQPANLLPVLEMTLQLARTAISAGKLDEAEDQAEKVIRAARRYRLLRAQAKATFILGLAAERSGDTEGAIRRYEQAEELLRDAPATAKAEVIAGKARCSHLSGDLRYAMYLLEKAIFELEQEGIADPRALLTLLAPLTFAAFEAGLYKQAGDIAHRALGLLPQVDDPATLATMHVNVARVLLQRGDHADALSSLEKAEELYRSLDFHTEVARALVARGYMLSRQGEFADAREQLEKALGLAVKTNSQLDEARCLNELARIARIEDNADGAIDFLHRSITLLGDGGAHVAELGLAHQELGRCLAGRDAQAAEKDYRLAIELFERSESAAEEAVTYRLLGDLLNDQGDGAGGIDAYRTGLLTIEERV